MNAFAWENLRKEERLAFALRGLYESYGYKKYRMSRFEEYSLYAENKGFLPSENVIAFSGADGRLLALRPDVTLSIVKNAPLSAETQKLWYTENVYRAQKESGDYKEIAQMGVEIIGDTDEAAEAELVALARKSLERIDTDCVLEISHMGFVDGFLSDVGLENAQVRKEFYRLLGGKNAHGAAELARREGLNEDRIADVAALFAVGGTLKDALGQTEKLARGAAAKAALAELQALARSVAAMGMDETLRLNFSIVNDIAYYNGIILQGFVRRAPKAVLAGGRYDNLLRKRSRRGGALGFAVYLGELDGYLREKARPVDAVLLYGDGDAAADVLAAAESLRGTWSVRIAKTLPEKGEYGRAFRLINGVPKEIEEC